MEAGTVKMSSRGQIVIPQAIRKELHAAEGTLFAVAGTKDMVMLRKIERPPAAALFRDLKAVAREGRRQLERKGITKEPDFVEMVHRVRKR